MLHSNLSIGEVDDVLSSLLKRSKNVTIASGYFGLSQVQKYRSDFIDILKDGGQVTLIHGLGKFEAIHDVLEKELRSLQNEIQKYRTTPTSGIFFATERRYHGKIYRIESETDVRALIGSSNFSKPGNIDNLEANILTSDKSLISQADHLIHQLMRYSQEYSPGILPVRKSRVKGIIKATRSKPPTVVPATLSAIMKRPVDFTLPLRVSGQEKSSLNLSFGLGRLTRPTTGKPYYKPRPYYEVEVTIPREFWIPPLTNFVVNSKSKPVDFYAYTDNGMNFACKFKRKTLF